jgi:hypothetical protein
MNEGNRRDALADEIERHIRVEDSIMQEYHVLSDKLPEGPLSVLINQVTTEEEMHHFLLSTLAEWLRSTPDEGPSAPSLGPEREEIVELSRLLQQHEQETITACGKLKSEMKGENGELFTALVDVLILDSQKHYRLLQALESIASK